MAASVAALIPRLSFPEGEEINLAGLRCEILVAVPLKLFTHLNIVQDGSTVEELSTTLKPAVTALYCNFFVMVTIITGTEWKTSRTPDVFIMTDRATGTPVEVCFPLVPADPTGMDNTRYLMINCAETPSGEDLHCQATFKAKEGGSQ